MNDIDQYLEQRENLDLEMHKALIKELQVLSGRYQRVFGDADGVKQLSEDLCRTVASKYWSNIVIHLNKISG